MNRSRAARLHLASAALASIVIACSADASRASGGAPEIRLSPTNRVPSCAAPDRLMAFLKSRNERLDPRYADVARLYRQHGDAWRVRWDYAFFQMIVETNALQFRRGNGEPGDVKPRQNNFAGIGTTGGGVPGDSYPDISTGVLAHVQHLVAYSGERMADPVAPRTQLKQGDIVEVSLKLKRPVTFADLARRWAVDRRYWQSIESIAEAFRAAHCTTQADLAPLSEAKALTLVPATNRTRASAALPPPAGLGGDPRMARDPSLAPRATAQAARANGPVRTIWRVGDGRPSAQPADQSVAPPLAQPTPKAASSTAPPTRNVLQPAAAPLATTTDAAPPPSPPSAVAAAPRTDAPATPPSRQRVADAATATGQAPAQITDETTEAPRKFAFASGLATRSAPAATTAATTAAPAQTPAGCSVAAASYGGHKALLIRSETEGRVRFTALSVLDGFESSMADNYIRTHAPGGRTLGEFGSSAEAVAKARELCGLKVSEATR